MADSDNDVPFSAVKPKNVSSKGTSDKSSCKKSKKNSKSSRESKGSKPKSSPSVKSDSTLKPSIIVTLPHLPATLPNLKLSTSNPSPSPKLCVAQSGHSSVTSFLDRESLIDNDARVALSYAEAQEGLFDPGMRVFCQEFVDNEVNVLNQSALEQYGLVHDPTLFSAHNVLKLDAQKNLYLVKDPSKQSIPEMQEPLGFTKQSDPVIQEPPFTKQSNPVIQESLVFTKQSDPVTQESLFTKQSNPVIQESLFTKQSDPAIQEPPFTKQSNPVIQESLFVTNQSKPVIQERFGNSDINKFTKKDFSVLDGPFARAQLLKHESRPNAQLYPSGSVSDINMVLKEKATFAKDFSEASSCPPGTSFLPNPLSHAQSKIVNLKGRLVYEPSVKSSNNTLNSNPIKEVRMVNSDEGPVLVEIPCQSKSSSTATNNPASNIGSDVCLNKSSNTLNEKKPFAGLVSVLDPSGNKVLIQRDLAVEYGLNFEEVISPIPASPAHTDPDPPSETQDSHVEMLYQKIAMLENAIHGIRGSDDLDDQPPSSGHEKNETVDPKFSTMRRDNLNFLSRLNSEDVLEVSDISEGEDDLPHSVNRKKTVKRLKFNKCILSALQSSERLLRSEKVNKAQKLSSLGPEDKASEMLYTSENSKVIYGNQNWPLPVTFAEVPLQQASHLPQVAKEKLKPDRFPSYKEPDNIFLQMKQYKHLEKGIFYVLQALSMTMTAVNALSSNLGRKENGNFMFYPDSDSNLSDRQHCLGLVCSSAKVACKLTADIKANLMAISRDTLLAKTDFNHSEKRQLRSLPFDPDCAFPMDNLIEMCEAKKARLDAAAQRKLLRQASVSNTNPVKNNRSQIRFEPYDSRFRQGGKGRINHSFRPSNVQTFATQSRIQRGGPLPARPRESQGLSAPPSLLQPSRQSSYAGRASFRGRRRGGNPFTPGVSGFK